MNSNKFTFVALFLICLLNFSVEPVRADSLNPKSKSVGLAVALGLDPIPGDALFYSGKTRAAIFDCVMGAIGIGLVIAPLMSRETGTSTVDREEAALSAPVLGLAVLAGSAIYLTSLIWDGVGGIGGVLDHNRKIKERYGAAKPQVSPLLSLTSDGGYVGAKFNF